MKIISQVVIGLFIITCNLAYAFQMPAGSYIESCTNLHRNGNILSAVCKNKQGEQITTQLTLENNCLAVQNIDGILTCTSQAQTMHEPNQDSQKVARSFNLANQLCPKQCTDKGMEWTKSFRSSKHATKINCECK